MLHPPNMESARAQVDEALSSPGLESQAGVRRLVKKTLFKSRTPKGSAKKQAPPLENEALERTTAELWGLLEELRGAADVTGGSGKKEWKVQRVEGDIRRVDGDMRVLYRENTGPAASHTICVECTIDEASKSDFPSLWAVDRKDAEGAQSIVHTFGPTEAHRLLALDPEPLFDADLVQLEEYAHESLAKDVTVMLMKVPSSQNGAHPPAAEQDTKGGFLFRRMSPSRCHFRAFTECNLQGDLETRIEEVARQVAGLGEAVFRKISERDFKDPSETAIRVSLKKGEAELGTILITAYEKIKQDLGEKLRQPGVIDRDAFGTWLRAAKLDMAGEPRVEFRPVEGCSSEELSKALLELEACGPNLENITTPGGIHLEVTIGGEKIPTSSQPDSATSSAVVITDDSESEVEFLDSTDELKEDSESEASGRERGPKDSDRENLKGPAKKELDAVQEKHPALRHASKGKAVGGTVSEGRTVPVRGGTIAKKTIGRKRPADERESVEDVLAKLASAVRDVDSEPTTSGGASAPKAGGVFPLAQTPGTPGAKDVVLGLGPGIATNRLAGGKPAAAPLRKDEITPLGGAAPSSTGQNGAPGMEISPLEEGRDGSDEDSDDQPSLVGSEDEESEDESFPPRKDYLTITDPDVLRARILELDALTAQLEAKSRQSTEWAHEKVAQATRKGQRDSDSIKKLQGEVEAAKQKLRDGEDKDRGFAKKLRDSEDMVKRTQDYAKGLEKKLFMLEKHLKEVRSELEASLLKESETAARETKALKAEKALAKKAVAWEKQRKQMQEEINSERTRANALTATTERAEETARQASVRARQEERAARDATERAAAEKRARELAEKEFKRKDAAAKRVSDAAAERFREEIKRLEREVTRLKLAEDESTLSARFGVNVRQAFGFDGVPPVYDVLTSPPRKALNGEVIEVAALREQNQRLRKEVAGLQNHYVRRERECVMCMSEEQSVVFLPCAHQVLCEGCNQEHLEKGHKDCPSCRTGIVQRIKVFGK